MNRRGLFRAWLALLPAFLAFGGCRWTRPAEAPRPLQERVTWCGKPASRAFDSILADTALPEACLSVLRLDFDAEMPLRLELRRYRDPVRAFAAWQSVSAGARSQDGCARSGSRWAFVHGEYLGLTDSSASPLYPEEFKERLAFAGEPVFILPPGYGAFPLRGRVVGSERLFLRDFLGGNWNGPVFSVAYQCHGDTAFAFRASSQNQDTLRAFMAPWKGRRETRKSGKEWIFEGRDEFDHPILIENRDAGILGFSGCWDRELVRDYAEKMRKMQVFWHNP